MVIYSLILGGKGNNRIWTESSFDVEWGKDLGFVALRAVNKKE